MQIWKIHSCTTARSLHTFSSISTFDYLVFIKISQSHTLITFYIRFFFFLLKIYIDSFVCLIIILTTNYYFIYIQIDFTFQINWRHRMTWVSNFKPWAAQWTILVLNSYFLFIPFNIHYILPCLFHHISLCLLMEKFTALLTHLKYNFLKKFIYFLFSFLFFYNNDKVKFWFFFFM